MNTYADHLRKIADMLDKDFRGNLLQVCTELASIVNNLLATYYATYYARES